MGMRRWIELGTAVSILVVGGYFMMHLWYSNGEPASAAAQPRDGFASDRPGGDRIAFDSKRAMEYLRAICDIGPRISGTDGMKRQQELLEKHFKDLGGDIRWQRFTARQKSVRKDTEMANLIISWYPERRRRVILCSHYDTRPLADQELNPRRWREPFISANDGGSGVALLMELAHHMKTLPAEVGVDFVFFDGEEYIWDPDGDNYFFGSKHFGSQYRKSPGKALYVAAVLLDMVGGKGALFPLERNSWRLQPQLVRTVWEIAQEHKIASFRSDAFSKGPIDDDHIALNNSGIPAIDIIDFDYRHWHRLTDVLENCSGESLEQVAQVLAIWLQRVK
jgi:hypothetical protein